MKPINSKDLPKVIGLGVATVGMLGFFTMTLMGAVGKKNNPAPPANPAATAGTAPAAVAPGTATVASGPAVTTVASNDRLVELGGPNEPFRKVLPEGGNVDPFPKVRLGGKLPRLRGKLRGAPIPVGDFGGRLGGGAVNMAPAAVIEPAVRLDGVMSDSKPYAMVTCAGRTEMFRVGARFGGMFEVVGINETGATFRGPKGVFQLEVGEEHVPAPATPAPADAGGPRVMEGNVEQMASHAPILPGVGR